jgi:uncharacterized repeat protein (TIGR01451 family)
MLKRKQIYKSNEKGHKYSKKRYGLLFLLFLLTVLTVNINVENSLAATSNFERVSVGTGGVQGNGESYFVSLSDDAAIVTFESFVSNWGPDQYDVNFVDIFIHDRTANTTIKISNGPGGEVASQRSFDPIVSADGRFVAFTSYAGNLVPNDTNRHDYVDDGLDVFLYDRVTGSLQRVSLDWKGEQIDANSVGRITGDARYVVFSSNGRNIIKNESNNNSISAVYVRDLQTGAIERITQGPGGAFPNGGVGGAEPSHDGRYIVYLSDATNIVPDNNGQRDVMLYDSQTGQTTLISKPVGGGESNGVSSPARITPDGRYIAFRSFATNLVPGDTNGKSDIFVYDTLTGEMEIVSVSSSGALGNGDSKDPAICGSGRFVSFTSDATNLVPIPHNGERQVYIHDRVTHTTFLATGTDTFMGNGRAHRSTLSNDCSTVGFATDASNLISGDTNGLRDLFVGEIIIPADLTMSRVTASGGFEAGSVVTYTFTLTNIGTETAVATFSSPIPANTTYVSGSVTGATATYNGSENAVQWTGNVPGEGEVIISYAVTVEPSLVDFTIINSQTEVSYAAEVETLEHLFAVNGLKTYLPIVSR